MSESVKIYKRICFIQLIFLNLSPLITNSANAQGGPESYPFSSLALEYNVGKISDQKRVFKSIQEHPSQGLTLSLSNSQKQLKPWQQEFKNAKDGFSLHYINLARNPDLGNVLGISRFIEFNLLSTDQFRLALKNEAGAALATKVFDPVENYKNILVSRHINFLFGFEAQASYRFSTTKGLGIKTGVSILHISNGETKIPNQGFNYLSYKAGVFYSWPQPVLSGTEKREGLKKPWDISVFPTIGYKEIWRYGGPKYLELSFSSDILYSINKKFMLGAGTDLLFDETLMVYYNHNEHPVDTPREAIDAGIHLAVLLNISRLQLAIRSGVPIYSGHNTYSTLYNTFGVKYYISEGFFICIYHKSHDLFFGDNVQWGFGYSILKGHRNFKFN